MNCHSDMIYEPKFWNYYDAFMTRKEFMAIICPINIASVWMPRWFYRKQHLKMLGCPGDFMLLRAILNYELSLRYDIWAYVLKLLWCLYNLKGIDGYYLSDKCCKCLDASMIL